MNAKIFITGAIFTSFSLPNHAVIYRTGEVFPPAGYEFAARFPDSINIKKSTLPPSDSSEISNTPLPNGISIDKSDTCHMRYDWPDYTAFIVDHANFLLNLKERNTGTYKPFLYERKYLTGVLPVFFPNYKALSIPDDEGHYFVSESASREQIIGFVVNPEPFADNINEFRPYCQSKPVQYALNGGDPPLALELPDGLTESNVQVQPLFSSKEGIKVFKAYIHWEYGCNRNTGEDECYRYLYYTPKQDPASTASQYYYWDMVTRKGRDKNVPNREFYRYTVSYNPEFSTQVVKNAVKITYFHEPGWSTYYEPYICMNYFDPELQVQAVGWGKSEQLYISGVTDNGELKVELFDNMKCQGNRAVLASYNTGISQNSSQYIERVWEGLEGELFVTVDCSDDALQEQPSCHKHTLVFTDKDQPSVSLSNYLPQLSLSDESYVVSLYKSGNSQTLLILGESQKPVNLFRPLVNFREEMRRQGFAITGGKHNRESASKARLFYAVSHQEISPTPTPPASDSTSRQHIQAPLFMTVAMVVLYFSL